MKATQYNINLHLPFTAMVMWCYVAFHQSLGVSGDLQQFQMNQEEGGTNYFISLGTTAAHSQSNVLSINNVLIVIIWMESNYRLFCHNRPYSSELGGRKFVYWRNFLWHTIRLYIFLYVHSLYVLFYTAGIVCSVLINDHYCWELQYGKLALKT